MPSATSAVQQDFSTAPWNPVGRHLWRQHTHLKWGSYAPTPKGSNGAKGVPIAKQGTSAAWGPKIAHCGALQGPRHVGR